MTKDTLRVTKARFAAMGIKLPMCNIADVKVLSSEKVGHAEGWTKDTIEVTTKAGFKHIYTAEPTGKYSAERKFTILKSSRC